MQQSSSPDRKARKGRSGRPPAKSAGEVTDRILDTAQAVFLERGFEATTFDEISSRAYAGKASIYARYPGKDELFCAVVTRCIESSLLVVSEVPTGLSAKQVFSFVGFVMLSKSLTEEVTGLMRLVIAEAKRFPKLALHAETTGRERTLSAISDAMDASSTPSDTFNLIGAANWFIDTVFMAYMMKALMAGNLKALQSGMQSHIETAVCMMVSGGMIPPIPFVDDDMNF